MVSISSQRSIAPFLPPEIIHEIIEHLDKAYYIKQLHLVSRIDSSWTAEAQLKLFTRITVLNLETLSILVPVLEENETLAELVLSLSIRLEYQETEEEIMRVGRKEEESDLFFRLLVAVGGNLRKLKFDVSFHQFSLTQQETLRNLVLLPKLVELDITTYAQDFDQAVCECILATAPNINSIKFDTLAETGITVKKWDFSPQKLKKLIVSDPRPFIGTKSDLSSTLSHSIWPLETYAGLEELSITRQSCLESVNYIESFAKAIGSTLKKIRFSEGTKEAAEIKAFIPHLKVLEVIQVDGAGIDDYEEFFIDLPSSTKVIKLASAINLDLALKIYQNSDKLLRLNSLETRVHTPYINLAHFPTTQSLRITGDLVGSLEQLDVGNFRFEELVLRRADFENQRIRNRCGELGIPIRWRGWC